MPPTERCHCDICTEMLEALRRLVKVARLVTIRQLLQADHIVVEAAGINPWCVNEGLATGDEMFDPWWAEAIIAKVEGR